MYRQALEGREKVLGLEHPDTSASIQVLVMVLKRQGKDEEAEAMARRLLEGDKVVALTLDHRTGDIDLHCDATIDLECTR